MYIDPPLYFQTRLFKGLIMNCAEFSVTIPEGIEQAGGYVAINHLQQYSIVLHNDDTIRRCDAEIFVDGKSIGSFRIGPRNTVKLERPYNDQGRFTFYRSGSTDASAAGEATISEQDKGLISVIFRPERLINAPIVRSSASHPSLSDIRTDTLGYDTDTKCDWAETYTPSSNMRSCPPRQHTNCSKKSISAGITGLSGKSSQQFVNVAPLDYDKDLEVTINLRLICDERGQTGARPLQGSPRTTCVPAPV